LARKNRAAVQVFLERVADVRTSAVALSCLDTASEPRAEMFLKFLHSRSASQRVAAALALGRLNQPAISRQLIATVLRGSCRQEALMALLASSEPSAQQFVMAAARDPLLSATLYSAQRHIQQFSSWGS
jgi:HEAT repeat protein